MSPLLQEVFVLRLLKWGPLPVFRMAEAQSKLCSVSTAENECNLSRSGHGRATVGRWPGLCPCFESLQRMVPLDRRCKFSALGAGAPFWSAVCGSGHDIRYLREGAEESQRKSSSIHKIKRRLTVDYMQAGSSLAAALACECDFAGELLLEFWRP